MLTEENIENESGHFSDNPKDIISGRGFKMKLSLVPKVLNSCTLEDKKCILFLYSLNADQFKVFSDYLTCILSNYSNRLFNRIRFIGYRNFYVNFLFGEEARLYKIPGFGKKSVHEFQMMKPQIISFVREKYEEFERNGFDSSVMAQAIDKRPNESTSSSPKTLKEIIGEEYYSILVANLNAFTENLSVRASNGIKYYKGDFIEDFVHKGKDVKVLRNIGKKTESEITRVVLKLKDIVDKITDQSTASEDVEWLTQKNIFGDILDQYAHDYYNQHSRLPMLHIVETCLRKMTTVHRNIDILNQVAPFFRGSQPKTRDEVAESLYLDRERIRQICVSTRQCLSLRIASDDYAQYSLLINQKKSWFYLAKLLENKVIWRADDLHSIIEEDCGLSDGFLVFLLSVLFPQDYILIGRNPLPVSRNDTTRNETFLVKSSCVKAFNFKKMGEILDDYIENSDNSLTATAKELLIDLFFTAWNDYDPSIVDNISQIVSIVLINEFGLIPDLNSNFTIQGHKKISPNDYMYMILKERGETMNVDELFAEIQKKYPRRYKSSQSIIGLISREPKVMRVGDQVALIEWDNVHLTSVRGAIVNYLQQFSVPKRLSEIVSHVIKIKETSAESIRSTMSTGKQFQQFEGGYYGLSDKTYPDEFFPLDNVQYYLRRIKDLENFILSSSHFPFSAATDANERSLCVFWKRIVNKQNLPNEVQNEIDRINQQYSSIPRNTKDYKWYSLCEEYRRFFEREGRRPDLLFSDECFLCRWFAQTQKDFEKGNLNEEQEKRFLELSEIL